MKRETDLEMELLRTKKEAKQLKEENRRLKELLEDLGERHPLTLFGEWREDDVEH